MEQPRVVERPGSAPRAARRNLLLDALSAVALIAVLLFLLVALPLFFLIWG